MKARVSLFLFSIVLFFLYLHEVGSVFFSFRITPPMKPRLGGGTNMLCDSAYCQPFKFRPFIYLYPITPLKSLIQSSLNLVDS